MLIIGFACFCYLLACILFLVAAFCMSPVFCGSNNEKKMISSPQEIDTGYVGYSEKATPSV